MPLATQVSALATRIGAEFKTVRNEMYVPTFGDLYKKPSRSKAPLSKATVSITAGGGTYDGYDGSGPSYTPQAVASNGMFETNYQSSQVAAIDVFRVIQTGPGGNYKPMGFTTQFEGTYLSINVAWFSNPTGDIRIFIDDEEIEDWYQGTRAAGTLQGTSLITLPAAANAYTININFATRNMRKIRVTGVVLSQGNLITTNLNSRFFKPVAAPVFAVLGDSYMDSYNTWQTTVSEIATELGGVGWNCAEQGTGFSNQGTTGQDHSYKSAATMAALAAAPADLAAVIVNGSLNDMGTAQATVQADMTTTFNLIRAARPKTPIIWVGIQSVHATAYPKVDRVTRENALRTTALAHPSVVGVIQPSLEDWISGTGYQGAANGSGNSDFWIGTDATHLTSYGVRNYGRLIAERTRTFKARIR